MVTALDGTVAVEQMNDIAVRVPDYLHFHVACAADEFLEINLPVAESLFGFATPQAHQF